MKHLLGLFVVLLVGCSPPEWGITDQKLRQELFFKCMKSLPAGPTATKYNDWDEVVAECGNQAKQMTYGCLRNCK